MKIFITGGTGFVGSHLLKRLSNSSHDIHCLVKSKSSASRIQSPAHNIHYGNILDKRSILEGMRSCDCVIHLAGRYSFWEADKRIYKKINVEGTRNVLEAAVQCNVSKFIHVSTGAVFGKTETAPITEDTPIGSEQYSKYAASKLEAERLAWDFHHKRQLPLIVVYPSGILGEGDDKPSGSYVELLIQKKMPALVSQDSVLTWVDVKDVAEGVSKLIEMEVNSGSKYIFAGHQISVGQFNKLVSDIADVPLPKIILPYNISLITAHLLNFFAKIFSNPPLFGMSVEQIRTMKGGLVMAGKKAEKELGLKYTPIRKTLEEMIMSLRKQPF